jgi:hypothetical protein
MIEKRSLKKTMINSVGLDMERRKRGAGRMSEW